MPTTTIFNLISSIEHEVQQHSLLQHPFYRAWSAGKLTKEHLAGYAKEYYWVAKHVPAVMEAIGKNLPSTLDERTRTTFKKHSREEQEHIELWERFASSLGVTQGELETYEPTQTVKDAVASIVEQAEQGFEEGIAAMYAFECDLPAISQSKIEGLQKFYGMTSADAHAYFEEHFLEERHLCFWRELLKHVTPEKVEPALMAAKAIIVAQNTILDGVVERTGVQC